MSDMPRKLPVHVVREVTRHKTVKFYFRKGKGPRIRLPDDLNSEEFKQAYAAAFAGKTTYKRPVDAPVQSLRWLVDRYKESGKWKGYSAATRKQQENFFLDAIKKSGNASYGEIDRKAIEQALDARADRPALANNFLKAMKALFLWAHRNGHVDINPTDGVESLRYKTEGFHAWTIADYKRFCEKWPVGTKPRLACELLLHSGLRRSDIVKAGRQHMDGNIFTMRTEKTGAVITVEFPETLMNTIASTETGDLSFLVSELGRPFVKESFGNWFGARCREAGLNLNAHGLRKLSATLAANAGAAAHELMAQYGWTNLKQAETYTKKADRASLGIRSSRRVSDQIENEISRTRKSGAGKIANNTDNSDS